jgi:hypothetical protein
MNHFVLDANIVIAEQYGAGAHMRALLSASSAVGFQVHLPKVALEEISAIYERDLSKNAKEAGKSLSKLSRLLGRSIDSSVEGFDSKEETKAFRERLRYRLGMTESRILDYPDTLHETLVKRATSRKRPFDDNGSGYRDALIWESVLELAKQVKGPIVLVTKDKDFREGSSNLHGDLIKDLERLGLPEDKVILATGLAGLVDQHVRPNLGMLPWDDPLQFLAQGGVNLEESITRILLEACSNKEWEPAELGIPWEYEFPTLTMVDDVSGLTVLDIRQLDSSQVLVKVEANVIGEFGVFVYKPNRHTSDDRGFILVEFDWNDHYVRAEIILPLHCKLDLVIDASNPEQQEVRNVSVEFQPIEFPPIDW